MNITNVSASFYPTFLSKCPLMMTWLAVTRSLQLDIANLVLVHALLFRSHTWGNNYNINLTVTGRIHNHILFKRNSPTFRVLSWLPLTTRVVSPMNLAQSTLPEWPAKI